MAAEPPFPKGLLQIFSLLQIPLCISSCFHQVNCSYFALLNVWNSARICLSHHQFLNFLYGHSPWHPFLVIFYPLTEATETMYCLKNWKSFQFIWQAWEIQSLKGIDRTFELRGEIRLIWTVKTNWRLGNFFSFILKGHHHKISKKP